MACCLLTHVSSAVLRRCFANACAFACCTQVLKQVHPELGISAKAMDVMNVRHALLRCCLLVLLAQRRCVWSPASLC
jgi:hypothetical protein